jgi:hypothetical protein
MRRPNTWCKPPRSSLSDIIRSRCSHRTDILTKFVVLAFSSGVFSNLLCAARMRLSHSSTNWKILVSYSFWNRAKEGSLGLAALAAKNSFLRRSVCDFGQAPRSIFCGTRREAADSNHRNTAKFRPRINGRCRQNQLRGQLMQKVPCDGSQGAVQDVRGVGRDTGGTRRTLVK